MFSYIINGMNEPGFLAYLEGEGIASQIPFNRYLPQHPAGVAQKWLTQHAAPGSWVLEPIGASPAAILEMAEAGNKVLVAANNPVVAFELEILAQAAAKTEFLSVLRELSVQKKGDERLQRHIQSLYLTRCATCGKEVDADYFLWRKSEDVPYAKYYRCTACGDEGEHLISETDIERLAPYKRSDPLHRARALEKIPELTRAARANLEELLKVYAPRPLYVIFTLINKIEGMSLSPARRELLDALLLSVLDAGHSLWPAGEGNERPRVLNIPSEYVEYNLWQALERCIETWCMRETPISVTRWPNLPEGAGICLYQGRMRDLLQQKPAISLESIYCVLPRPNQVFWSLSTLWCSWLWGKETAANFKNVLERQRFDWYWHTNALNSALAPAARMIKPGSPAFCLIPEPVPGFAAAAFEACCTANLQLSGLAYKDEQHPIQTEWVAQPANREVKKVNLHKIIREAINSCLMQIGEPCRYLQLYTAVMASLTLNEAYPVSIQQMSYDLITNVHDEILKVFADRKFLRRMDATSQDLISGYWWLAQPEGCQASLADRVEKEVVNLLQKETEVSAAEVQQEMNSRFTGFQTPPADLLEVCLQSYAELDKGAKVWRIRESEKYASRQQDLADIQLQLLSMAAKMSLTAEGDNPIDWIDPKTQGSLVYRLYYSSTAEMTRWLSTDSDDNVDRVFLFPGSRSGLIRYKLDRDPWMRERVTQRWHFLKFRTLRDLSSRRDLSRDLWDLLIDSDPISQEDATQLSMFL